MRYIRAYQEVHLKVHLKFFGPYSKTCIVKFRAVYLEALQNDETMERILQMEPTLLVFQQFIARL